MRLTTLDRLSADGAAVARAPDGRVVFVEGAAPDEDVEVQVFEQRKRHMRARLVSVIRPGPDRVTPRCRHFGRCGGCRLQHVDAEAQARLKTEAALQTVRRVGRQSGLGTTVEVEPTWRGPAYGTRSRVRWLWMPGEGLGYRQPSSHQGWVAAECPVLEPALQAALTELGDLASSAGPPAARRPRGGWEVQAVTDGTRVGVKAPFEVPPPYRARTLEVQDRAGTRAVRPEGFSQNHRAGNDALLETLERWLPQVERAVELFAGSGNFTRVLERKAATVVAVESDRGAVARARRILSPSTEVRQHAAESVDRVLEGAQLVLVDPPRTGLSEILSRRLAQISAPIVYVSCDPGTFARDLQRLSAGKHRLVRLRAFDLYPQTAHLELMAAFSPDAREPGA